MTERLSGYLAYKMRDEPLYNFPWSHRVTAALRAQGFDVFNPAEHDESNGFDPATSIAQTLDFYMQDDLPEVCRRQAIFLGKNWRISTGACLEGFTAATLGKKCYEVVEHEGSCRDQNELHVALKRIDNAVVLGLCYQHLACQVSA